MQNCAFTRTLVVCGSVKMVILKIFPKKKRIFGVACGFFIAIGGVLGWIILPYLVVKLIDLNVILYKNSEQFERWQTLPQPMEFKIYIFNVTNADEIINGALPIFKEVGPYVYKQYQIKNVEEISKDEMNITYRNRNSCIETVAALLVMVAHLQNIKRPITIPVQAKYKYDKFHQNFKVVLHIKDVEIQRIVGKLLKILNKRAEETPIVGSVKRLIEIISGKRKAVLQITEDIINSQLGFVNKHIFRLFSNESSLFMRTTPKQFFFDGIPFCVDGPVDEIKLFLCNVVHDVVKHRNIKAIRKIENGGFKFAFFYYKNNTDDGQYKILSGLNNSKLTSRILTYEAKPYLTFWENEKSVSSCNMFEKSTDGVLFPPHLKPEGSLNVFSTDICRTVQLFYKRTISYRNIIGYRFETGDNFINKIGSKYATKCFCTTTLDKIPKYNDGCLYKGVMDLSSCHGAPIIMSMPHLLDAAPEYQTVKGLKPNLERGITYVDIEPNTEYPLRGYKRAQFNMFVRKVDKIDFTNNLRTFLMPIIWIEEGTQLKDKMIKLLNDKMFTPLQIASILIYTAIGTGITIF